MEAPQQRSAPKTAYFLIISEQKQTNDRYIYY